MMQLVEEMRNEVARLKARENERAEPEPRGPTKIERDENGLVVSVDGRAVKRNAQGLIEEIE